MKTISRNEQIINKKETGSYRIGICEVLPKITEFDSSATKRSYAYGAIITLLILCTLVLSAPAQPVQLDMQVFAQRRAGFMAQMQPDAIAIFPGKPVYLRNNDVEYSYRQESNFYYLSGFEEPESLLLLDPSAPKYKYVMYVAETRPRRRET